MNKILLALLVLTITAAKAERVTVGLSPPRLYADHLLPGSSLERELLLSRSDQLADLIVSITVPTAFASWIKVNQTSFTFSRSQESTPLRFLITVPPNAGTGEYNTSIEVHVKPIASAGITTEVVFPIDVRLNVTDREYRSFRIRTIRVPDTQEHITILLPVENNGNARAGPSSVNVSVRDQFNTRELFSTTAVVTTSVPPFSTQTLEVPIRSELDGGQYLANVTVLDGDNVVLQDAIMFDVVRPTRPWWILLAVLMAGLLWLHKRRLLCLVLITACAHVVIAADPLVGPITAPSTVALNADTTKIITCNATITDADGFENITVVNATFFDAAEANATSANDNNNHYTNTNCTLIGGSGITTTAVCEFLVWHYANPSPNWTCNLTATDGIGTSTNTTGNLTVQELKALSVHSFNYDNSAGGTISLGAVSAQAMLNVTNAGNVNITVQVNGDTNAMTCTVGTIPLDNERYNITAGFAFDNGTALSNTAINVTGFMVARRTDDATPSVNSLYWLLKIPSQGVGGTCTGSITINAN
ncbi:hypothetical protein HY490_03825 [Candidatus Woesearchaeota archaeon]|nr:hypothetical protein [Candidatus Woesearchaeota archaeon]